MDYNDIHTILEKYWKGDSSLEEERKLKSYFNSGNVDHSLKEFIPLFQFTEKEKQLKIQEDFKVPLTKGKVRKMSVRKWVAAACLLLMSGLFIFNMNNSQNDKIAYQEITDKDEAYKIAKEALFLVSTKLNKGAKKAAIEIEKVKTINRFIKHKK